MIAIVSDIHANLEALQAVLEDMTEFDIKAVFCLGDVVGYGPNPRECLDLAMKFDMNLVGNHEEAATEGPVGFRAAAAEAIEWTRKQLNDVRSGALVLQKRWQFLKNLRTTYEERDFLFVHASPRNPTREYIFPEDISDSAKIWDIFRRVKRYCFMGHTHVPGIITDELNYYTPEELGGLYKLDNHKILCNVGSVGQPRDGDWRACYCLMDQKAVAFRRVPYDVETTIKKVKAIPELKAFLGYFKKL
jgi:diadenosine tetraphosphatase ApaH/serine/threonine PP2A family protein phosphatase